MLQGLDDIGWRNLTHAYGTAEDVPDLLRALASADPQARHRAREALYGNIFHQGTRYEATAYAVPFLLELLADSGTPDRAALTELLTSIAIGYDESWIPDGMPIARLRAQAARGEALFAEVPRPGDADYDEEEGAFAYLYDLPWGEQDAIQSYVDVAAYDAVRSGVPHLRELLAADDPELARAAAYALAWFPEEAEESVRVLSAAGASEAMSATAIVAIGLLGGRVPNGGLDPEQPALIRWAAAIATARVDAEAADRRAIDELLSWASGPRDVHPAVPYLGGDLAGYASLALRQLGAVHSAETFDALIAGVAQASGASALPVVGAALVAAFPDGPPAPDSAFDDLLPDQQRLVLALATSPSTWRLGDYQFGNFILLVGDYGLPASYDEMRRWARLTNP